AQNEAEVDVYTDPAARPIVARIYDYDPEFRWVVSELVRPIRSAKEFEALTGLRWRDFVANVNRAIPNLNVFPKRKVRNDSHWMIQATHALMRNKGLLPGDIAGGLDSLKHWGKTADGRVVLLDYGFTAS